MGIPPGVPVKAAKSIGFAPRIVARIVQAHNGRHTLRGHAQATSTSTTVGVTRLAGPDFMIEIEAVAIVNS
jgi:hypothetical protein